MPSTTIISAPRSVRAVGAALLLVASLALPGGCKERRRHACIRACAMATREGQAACTKSMTERQADACYEAEATRSLPCLQKCL